MYVIDASVSLDENDRAVLEMIKDKNTIILLNKSDLPPVLTEEDIRYVASHLPGNGRIIRTSMKEGEGIDLFLTSVKEMFFHGGITYNDEVYITNVRHKEALSEAYDSILQVQKSIENKMPEDFYTIDMMSAYASLGRIIGEEVGDDLVDEIFSKFCMGK